MQARIEDFELESIESVVRRLWAAIATTRTLDEAWEKMALVLRHHRAAIRMHERFRIAAAWRAKAGELVNDRDPTHRDDAMIEAAQLLAAAQVLEDFEDQ